MRGQRGRSVTASLGTARLRSDALAIWRAGVDAVNSERLVRGSLRARPNELEICGRPFALQPESRIVAVGAGKAGAGMAAGVEAAVAGTPLAERLTGWVNVPADCVRPLGRIHLHAARPAGVNEPTAAGVAGANEILRRVRQLSADDLCIVLISGRRSLALLPAPAPGLSLADKLAVTRLLMAGGATINELNCVRKHLSAIKGGNLARGRRRRSRGLDADHLRCTWRSARRDCLGTDRGRPVDGCRCTGYSRAELPASRSDVPEAVWTLLESNRSVPPARPLPATIQNFVIGNNEDGSDCRRRQGRREAGLRHSLVGQPQPR